MDASTEGLTAAIPAADTPACKPTPQGRSRDAAGDGYMTGRWRRGCGPCRQATGAGEIEGAVDQYPGPAEQVELRNREVDEGLGADMNEEASS